MDRLNILTWILRLHGVFLLAALVPVFFPHALMDNIHKAILLESLPQLPITGYLTRSLSLVYALHGSICLLLALNVRQYLPLIRSIAILHLIFGLVLTGIDFVSEMPMSWVLCEGPPIVAFAIFVYLFAGSCQTQPQQHDAN